MASICFTFLGSNRSPILLKFSLFSVQLSGFSTDFHRKLLDIVNSTQTMPEYELIDLAKLSRPDIGEHKFDKNWELENGKKSGFWRSKK